MDAHAQNHAVASRRQIVKPIQYEKAVREAKTIVGFSIQKSLATGGTGRQARTEVRRADLGEVRRGNWSVV